MRSLPPSGGFGSRCRGSHPEDSTKEAHHTLIEQRMHVEFISELAEWSSRSELIFARIVLVHFVKQLNCIAEVKMVRAFDDFESSVRAEAFKGRANARVQID